MKDASKIYFKEWLPDLPPLDNPGLLEVTNALPVDGTYRDFRPLGGIADLATTGGIPGTYPRGAFVNNNSATIYVAVRTGASVAPTAIYKHTTAIGGWTLNSSTLNGSSPIPVSYVRHFVEFDGEIYVDGQTLQVASTGSFTEITSGPVAQHVAVVNNFLVAGNNGSGVTAAAAIRWSSIGDGHDWPTPSSATAIARQSGEQYFNTYYGAVSGVSSGEESAVVLQEYAVNRMTYVGNNVVFQFDRINSDVGCNYPNATIQYRDKTYFISKKGFYVTDGYNVTSISDGRVSRYFRERVNNNFPWAVSSAVDYERGLIYFSYANSTATTAAPVQSEILIYNVDEGRWGSASQNSYGIFGCPQSDYMYGFSGVATLGSFDGTSGSAVFVTGDVELNTGGKARVDGVKPLVDATLNAVTVAIGTRDHLGTAVTYGAATTANSRTGFADFRSEANYHRAKVTVSGTFNAAQGVEIRAVATGKT